MARITGNPKQMRLVARRIKNHIGGIRHITSTLNSQINQIYWEGKSRRKFNGRYRDWKYKLQISSNNLDHIVNELEMWAKLIERADRSN